MEYLKDYKIINDTIHNSISLSKLATLIIDTPEFQRLRYIKQLSTCYFVFPNAVHTRFEHSIGTYHICKKMLYYLRKNSEIHEINLIKDIPELKSYISTLDDKILLDNYIIELVAIGALCHDLGHGPFSHLFDDNFLKNKTNIIEENKYHEHRSCILLSNIIKNNAILSKSICNEHITFIHNIINPNRQIHTNYIYQIVSNGLNSIDVDKFDYLTRDSKMLNINISFNFNRLIENALILNNIICYPKKIDSDIINMFQTRYYMHKKVYAHKSVISSLLVITELFDNLDKIINFTDSVNDMNNFIKYTDDYVMCLCRYFSSNNATLKKIIDVIDNHSFYKLIYHNYIDVNSTDNKYEKFVENDDIVKFENTIGFITGKKNNPLDFVYLYNAKNPYNTIEILSKSDSACLLSSKYQEKLVMVFCKK